MDADFNDFVHNGKRSQQTRRIQTLHSESVSGRLPVPAPPGEALGGLAETADSPRGARSAASQHRGGTGLAQATVTLRPRGLRSHSGAAPADAGRPPCLPATGLCSEPAPSRATFSTSRDQKGAFISRPRVHRVLRNNSFISKVTRAGR